MRRTQLAAYVGVVAVAAAGLWRVESTANEANDAARAVDHEAQTRADESCVTAWSVREDIRDAIEKGAKAHQEALLAAIHAVQTNPNGLAQFERIYREALPREFVGTREEIPDPDCDLDAAERRLGD